MPKPEDLRPLRVACVCPKCSADVVMAVCPAFGSSDALTLAALSNENLRLRKQLREVLDAKRK